MFRARIALLALAVPAVALSVTAGQANAAAPIPAIAHPVTNITMGGASPNWAGYVAYGRKFRYVTATFEVPRLDCARTPGYGLPAVAAAWVGLDGDGTRTVEQDGIMGQCLHGAASYYAWWEMYPKAPVYAGWRLRPGDIIDASVWYDAPAGKYRLDLTDRTSGASFSNWERCGASSCANATAEVITESPGKSGSSGYYPLADWGTSSYWDISITDGVGQRGGFDSGHWTSTSVRMVGTNGDTKTATGGLSSSGTTFRTYWENRS